LKQFLILPGEVYQVDSGFPLL